LPDIILTIPMKIGIQRDDIVLFRPNRTGAICLDTGFRRYGFYLYFPLTLILSPGGERNYYPLLETDRPLQ
jgi:hypothetical protein